MKRPEDYLESQLREQISRACGKAFRYSIAKSVLPALLPPDRELHPYEIIGVSVHEHRERRTGPLPLRLPESSLQKLKRIATKLGLTVITESHYCYTHDCIELVKTTA